MLSIEISQPGDADVLQPITRAKPILRSDEVLIKVAAAGINRPDVMQRKGLYPPPPEASDIPGLEVAGTVIAIGRSVTRWKNGDQVCALLNGGGYAEYCSAHEQLCLPIPQGCTAVQAAALPETYFTTWSNLFDRGKLSAGETLLIHGGASGIGTTAIQFALFAGARPIVTAGSDEKCLFCKKLGASASINYQHQDFVQAIMDLTDNQGVNVILDMIGGKYFPKNINCLGNDGRLLQIAVQDGPKSEINLLAVMLKRLTITGSTLRARDVDFKARIAIQLQQHIWPQLAKGMIKPVIHCTFPLREAAKAHKLMESSQHTGKIILTVNDSF